jgi:hypothetical protein
MYSGRGPRRGTCLSARGRDRSCGSISQLNGETPQPTRHYSLRKWVPNLPGATALFELHDETRTTSQLTLIIGGILDQPAYAANASSSPYYVVIAPEYDSFLLEIYRLRTRSEHGTTSRPAGPRRYLRGIPGKYSTVFDG